MNTKSVLVILIILIIVMIIGVIYFDSFQNEKIKVGDIYYTIPNGYHLDKSNSLGDLTISNETNSISFASFNDTNITKHSNYYKKEIAKNNQSASSSKLVINNITIYKNENDDTGAIHYWFVYGKKVYTIYSWNNTSANDKIFINLIETIN